MSTLNIPPKARIWQYSATKGGVENHLKLNNQPIPAPKPGHHIIKTIATALNPVDYKAAEFPFVGRFMVPKLATPGIDIVGRIASPAAGSALKPGQLVFGVAGASPFAAGGLAEYVSSPEEGIVALPEGVAPIDAATIGVAGLTAHQSILAHVKKGDKVFINGGSGGVGVFGIQVAKAAGCYVAVTCSTPNVELCKSLGADMVVDYKKADVVQQLVQSGVKFDHVVDNVGSNKDLYWKCHQYTRPGALFVSVAASPSPSELLFNVKAALWPGFLGGAQRRRTGIFAQTRANELQRIVDWMKEGQVKAVIDSRFPLEQVPEAFRRLKTGRAKGKIVIEVSSAEDRA